MNSEEKSETENGVTNLKIWFDSSTLGRSRVQLLCVIVLLLNMHRFLCLLVALVFVSIHLLLLHAADVLAEKINSGTRLIKLATPLHGRLRGLVAAYRGLCRRWLLLASRVEKHRRVVRLCRVLLLLLIELLLLLPLILLFKESALL